MVYHLLTEHTQIDISGGYQLPFVPAKPMLLNFSTSSEAGGSNYGGTQMLVFQHEKMGRSDTFNLVGEGHKRRKEGSSDGDGFPRCPLI